MLVYDLVFYYLDKRERMLMHVCIKSLYSKYVSGIKIWTCWCNYMLLRWIKKSVEDCMSFSAKLRKNKKHFDIKNVTCPHCSKFNVEYCLFFVKYSHRYFNGNHCMFVCESCYTQNEIDFYYYDNVNKMPYVNSFTRYIKSHGKIHWGDFEYN